MSVNVHAMRGVLCCVIAVAACSSDPTLHVTVTHPADSQVVKTVVSVYEGAFGCVDVEFGDLTHEQLAASLVAEETLADGAAPIGNLDGISRTDPKVVVARGYGSDGRLRTEGCAEKGTVTGADELALATVMTATASVALADPTRQDLFGLAVAATDPDGKELDARPVSWRVYAPVGATPAAATVATASDSSWTPNAPTCTSNGVALIHPVPPSTVGGYAIQARVAWSAEPVPLYSAIVADLSIAQLTPPANVTRACAIGRAAGIPKLVCLTGGGATIYSVSTSGALGGGSSVALANPIGVYAVPNGTDADVWAMDKTGVPTRVFPSSPGMTGSCGGCSVSLDDVMFLPACGNSPAKVLVHDTTTAAATQVKWMDPTGGTLVNFPTTLRTGEGLSKLELESAGCASELDPMAGTYTTQQVAVIDLDRPATGVPFASRAHFACGTGMCQSIDLSVPGAAAGFSGGMQPYVIGTAIDATGVVLTSLLIVKDGSGDHWVELARQPSASLPHRIVTGQLDDDSSPDKVWDMKTKLGGLVEIAYARMIGTEPLAGLSLQLEQQEPPLVALDLLVGDVTGDGKDDIIVVGQTVDAAKTGVAVAPSHAPAPIGTLKMDPTCAP